ncbi:MAG: sodium:solute symporter family protein, partial [Candidatus Bathyarchaeia archaeon]
MENWILIAACAIGYMAFLVLLGSGPWVQKFMPRIDDYYKSMPGLGFTLMWFGWAAAAQTAFGLPGAEGFYYSHGILFVVHGIWTLGMPLIMLYLIMTRVCAIGRRKNYITPGDFFEDVYDSKLMRVLYSVFMLAFTVFYLLANVSGPALLLEGATGGNIPYWLGCTIIVWFTVIYVTSRGIRGCLWTDVAQGAMMLLCVWLALFYALSITGGPQNLFNFILEKRPALLTLPGGLRWGTYGRWLTWGFFGITIGWALQPRMWLLAYSARSVKDMKKQIVSQPLFHWLFLTPAMFLAFAMHYLLPDFKGSPDLGFSVMLGRHFPAILAAFIISGSAAAGMSTMDIDLGACSAIFTRDIYQRFLVRDKPAEHYLTVGRIMVPVMAALGFIGAIYKWTLITMIVTIANTGMAQVLPAVLGGIFPRTFRFTKVGVVAGLVAGTIAVIWTTFIQV